MTLFGGYLDLHDHGPDDVANIMAGQLDFLQDLFHCGIGALLRIQRGIAVAVLAVLERLVRKGDGCPAESDPGNQNPESGGVLGELHLPMAR